MLSKVILLKCQENYEKEMIDVLKMLLGSHIQVLHEKEMIVIYHDYDLEEQILETIQSLENDLNSGISFYQGVADKKLLPYIVTLFAESKYGHYDFKSLLAQADCSKLNSEILDVILEGSGVTRDIISAMAECDLNVSKAAQVLYMHRNTLLYKLDRLQELKQFDLRKFYDEYLLVKLLIF